MLFLHFLSLSYCHIVLYLNVVPLGLVAEGPNHGGHTEKPLQQIQLVGALVQQHTAALARPSGPPGAGIVIRLAAIPVGDGPAHALDGAHFAGINDLLQAAVEAVGALLHCAGVQIVYRAA